MKTAPEKKKKRPVEEPVRKKKAKGAEAEPVRKKKKKIKVDEEVVKKSKGTALAVVGNESISRLDADGLATILGSSAEKIQQLLEVGNADSATNLIQKRMLQALIDLLPHAEANVRATRGQKGVYQINSLITSVREILSDLQAAKDRGALGDSLVEKIVRPTFLDIGMALVQEEQSMSAFMRDNVDIETFKKLRAEHRESIKRIGVLINRKYEEAKTNTIAFLQS